MKKKFLSLALVLAMALTLLPTVALAVDHSADTHTNFTYDNQTATQHTKHCATQDCTMEPVVENHTWGTNDSAGKCTVCEYQCQHSSRTWQVNSQNSAQCEEVCDNCGVVTTSAQNHVYTKQTGSCDNCGTAHTGHNYDKNAATPTGKCTVCGAPCNHGSTAAGATCDTCGVTKPADPTPITKVEGSLTPAPATAGGAVTFTIQATPAEASSDLEVKSIAWTNASGAADDTGSATKAPTTAGTYTATVTVGLKSVNSGKYSLTKEAVITIPDFKVNPPLPETPTTPETPKEDNTPPSTNGQGIPVASEVSTPTQANQAINILKNTNANTLQERLMTNETAASSFASLENAVKRAKGISVSVDVTASSAPSAVRSGVNVTGAAFNASGSSVKLVVAAPSQAYSPSSGYQISMTLTGVSNPAKLAVPVIITLPLPSDVRADRVKVLHYHDGSSNPAEIIPAVSGNSLRFTVTGFSDFVVTDRDSDGNDGVSHAFTTVPGGNRNDGTLDDATLASIAAMLSGDGVFVDVPGTHWAAKEIRWARDGGLMSGYGNGSFGPTASTTRQQLWMVLARLSGTRPADMAMARQWAINTGVSDGSNPTGVLSRQQLVTMLYRFAKSQGKDVSASAKLSGYTDSAKVASYAKEALSWAAAKGIMSGSNGKLNPEGTATRAHFAVFLYRYSNG